MKRQIDNVKKNTTNIFKGDKCQLHNINCGPPDFLKFFPIKGLWELYVATATRVPIQSVQNLNAAFLPT